MGKEDTSEHFPLMAPGFMAKVPQLQILLVSAQPGLGLVDQPGGATQSRADACLSGAERWGIIAGGAKHRFHVSSAQTIFHISPQAPGVSSCTYLQGSSPPLQTTFHWNWHQGGFSVA